MEGIGMPMMGPVIKGLSPLGRLNIVIAYERMTQMRAFDLTPLYRATVGFDQIADLAIEYKAGARSLRGIFEGMMTDVLYTIADDKGIRRVTIPSLFDVPRYER